MRGLKRLVCVFLEIQDRTGRAVCPANEGIETDTRDLPVDGETFLGRAVCPANEGIETGGDSPFIRAASSRRRAVCPANEGIETFDQRILCIRDTGESRGLPR